jgi:hypothetical protein
MDSRCKLLRPLAHHLRSGWRDEGNRTLELTETHCNTNPPIATCLGTVPKCVAGVPNLLHFPRCLASKWSLYSVFRSSWILAIAVRSSYSYSHPLLGHNFVQPSLCRCRRSSHAEPWQPPGHTATAARRPSAASVMASWDIQAAADPICTVGRVWEMRR